VLGPLSISCILDTTDSYALAFYIVAGIMIASAVVAFFIVRAPKREARAGAPQAEEARA
jgi:MFS transporter, OFA family, oxalate/formate antiporter